jgi:hypothetical protein
MKQSKASAIQGMNFSKIEKIDAILEKNYGNIREALKEVGVEND